MQIECHAELPEDRLAEWRAFLAEARHQHPRQDPRFASVERALGRRVLHVLGRQQGKLRAVGLFTLTPSRIFPGRFSEASALSGPVCDDPATMVEFIAAFARSSHVRAVDSIRITPYWLGEEAKELAQVLSGAGLHVSDPEPFRDTGLIDLTRSEDAIFSSFSRSARRKVRLIEKSDVVIRPIEKLAEAKVFFERLNRLVLNHHRLTPVRLQEYEVSFPTVYRNPAIGVIFGAYNGDEFLGGLLLYRSARTAHARRYVADPEAARAIGNLRVAPALWLAGMLWAKRQGCVCFDVEGYRHLDDENDSKFNVYEYKREFSTEYITRIAEHTLPLNRLAHAIEQGPKKMKQIAGKLLRFGKKFFE